MISVCIPVYNAEGFIAETVESVLRQTARDFELVIVDDRSTDRTAEILSKYRDDRIRLVINDKNLGPEKNWNTALGLARGTFIKILCHDDILYPGCLEAQSAVLSSSEFAGVALVCCKRDIVDRSGRRLLSRGFPGQSGRRSGKDATRAVLRWGTNIIGEPSAVLFRADAARRAGSFNARFPYVIDLDFWLRLMRIGDLYVIREPLCAFRVFAETWSMALAHSQRKHYLQLAALTADDYASGVTRWDLRIGKITSIMQVFMRKFVYFTLKMRLHPNKGQ